MNTATHNDQTPIETFLAANAYLRPQDIFIPEQCALCIVGEGEDENKHAFVNVVVEEGGHISIDEVPDRDMGLGPYYPGERVMMFFGLIGPSIEVEVVLFQEARDVYTVKLPCGGTFAVCKWMLTGKN